MHKILKSGVFVILLATIFMAGVFMRPALPVDETRYLSVAWEMWLKNDWIHLTSNFAPYHHKPPLLFWLINIFWHMFGVSRWAGTLPMIIASVVVVFLTRKLAHALFPSDEKILKRTELVLLGSVPFLIYGSLIMFDMLLTVFVLGALLFLLRYAEKRDALSVICYGLCMGFGLLTKGPVVYIYAFFPALLAPFWLQNPTKKFWIGGCAIALALSALPILLWLAPLVQASDHDFIRWLVWRQTAGRISGDFSDAHVRPFYFYVPLIPIFFLPWILFPSFWRGLKSIRSSNPSQGLRFLMIWMLPGFVAFSLISGKQPHYLVPFLPGVVVVSAYFMKNISMQVLKKTVLAMFVIFIAGHAIAMKIFFPLYDWRKIAAYLAQHQDKSWAFVRNYNNELGFYARLQKPVEDEDIASLPEWFKKNPDGLAVIRYKRPSDVKDYEAILIVPYRPGRYAGVFGTKKSQ